MSENPEQKTKRWKMRGSQIWFYNMFVQFSDNRNETWMQTSLSGFRNIRDCVLIWLKEIVDVQEK